jgi:hypothetical protein
MKTIFFAVKSIKQDGDSHITAVLSWTFTSNLKLYKKNQHLSYNLSVSGSTPEN